MNWVKIYWVNFTSEIYELRIRNQMSERAAFFFHAFQKWEGKVHVHKPFNLTYYILVYFYFLCYFPAEKCVSTAMTGALNYKRNETKNETKKKKLLCFITPFTKSKLLPIFDPVWRCERMPIKVALSG